MLYELTDMIERLNLSYHKTLVGQHFTEILGLLSITFGGAFLLFAWRHHRYFLGVTGLLVGCWAGLLAKVHLGSTGQAPAVLYLAVCGVAGAYVGVYFRKFMGMLLGGFTVAVLGTVILPDLFQPGNYSTVTVGMAFLLGGGMGAIFPKFFFIFNSSLIGSIFATYGISTIVLSRIAIEASDRMQLLLHLLVFLPLLLFGILYQIITNREATYTDFAASEPPRPRSVRPSAYS